MSQKVRYFTKQIQDSLPSSDDRRLLTNRHTYKFIETKRYLLSLAGPFYTVSRRFTTFLEEILKLLTNRRPDNNRTPSEFTFFLQTDSLILNLTQFVFYNFYDFSFFLLTGQHQTTKKKIVLQKIEKNKQNLFTKKKNKSSFNDSFFLFLLYCHYQHPKRLFSWTNKGFFFYRLHTFSRSVDNGETAAVKTRKTKRTKNVFFFFWAKMMIVKLSMKFS